MSQNVHTMLLFFDKKRLHDRCLLMFYKLSKDEVGEALQHAAKLKVDIEEIWNEDWFNHAVSAQPDYIRVDFETSVHYSLPLTLLKQLFDSGMAGAAIETFYDQVGELSRHFFADGKMVDEKTLYARLPDAESLINSQFESDAEDVEYDQISEPIAIESVLKQEEQSRVDTEDAIKAIHDVMGLAKESGSNPLELMKSILLLHAGGKGLLHAFLFGLVTILLFKGLWLWILLTLALAVILPLYYMHHEQKALDGDADDDEDEAEDLTNTEAANAD
jgi:hypothetical protein